MRCRRQVKTVLFLLATSGSASELELRFHDEEGKAVEVDRVEVLVWAWGEERRFVHGSRDGASTVPLGYEWLEGAWPERARDVWTARLVIQAAGYVPVVTRGFHWPGTEIPGEGRFRGAQIDFDGRQRLNVGEGERAAFQLALRLPKERWLRLVDESGRPVAGTDLRIDAYGSIDNHCGRHWPALKLGAAKSDADGRVRIPDGDFEYALEIETRFVVLAEPSSDYYPKRLFSALSQKAETVVRLHPWKKRRLRIQVTRQGADRAHTWLGACLSGCPCGACCGSLAQTDASGRIDIEEFYPERYDVIYFMDQAGKERIWEVEPSELPGAEVKVIDVDLSSAG